MADSMREVEVCSSFLVLLNRRNRETMRIISPIWMSR